MSGGEVDCGLRHAVKQSCDSFATEMIPDWLQLPSASSFTCKELHTFIHRSHLYLQHLTWRNFTHCCWMPAIPLVAVWTLDKDGTITQALSKYLPSNVVQSNSSSCKTQTGTIQLLIKYMGNGYIYITLLIHTRKHMPMASMPGSLGLNLQLCGRPASHSEQSQSTTRYWTWITCVTVRD